jgi:hypothetical protein
LTKRFPSSTTESPSNAAGDPPAPASFKEARRVYR